MHIFSYSFPTLNSPPSAFSLFAFFSYKNSSFGLFSHLFSKQLHNFVSLFFSLLNTTPFSIFLFDLFTALYHFVSSLFPQISFYLVLTLSLSFNLSQTADVVFILQCLKIFQFILPSHNLFLIHLKMNIRGIQFTGIFTRNTKILSQFHPVCCHSFHVLV